MDTYTKAKQEIQTQDNYRCDEFIITIPVSLFKERKEAEKFVKVFYWSPTYVMKKLEWERVEVKPKTKVDFIKEDQGLYVYTVKQEWILPIKEK